MVGHALGELALKHVVVTGASGFIGTRLVRQLVADGVRVTALDRVEPRERLPAVAYVTLDVRQPIDPVHAQDAERIYNFAAVHRTPGHPAHEYYDTNIFGALNVVRLAEAAGVKTVIFTSSISVYGPSEETVTESSPLRPVSDYGRSKRMAELIHEQWLALGDGRRLIVTRPGVIFGPGERGNYTALAQAMKRGIFAYPGRRDTIKSGGYVDELLRAIAFASERDEPYILFNYAYPTFSTSEQIVQTLKRIAGFSHSPPTLPLPLLIGAAQLFEVASRFGLRTPIHRERVLKLVNSTKVWPGWLTDHGYVFQTDLESALLAWQAENKDFR
jgi:nucleoside-diphosphate-sugar epimerase